MGFGYIRCFKTIRRKPKITDTETTVVFLQADGIHPKWNQRFHMGSSACFYDKTFTNKNITGYETLFDTKQIQPLQFYISSF